MVGYYYIDNPLNLYNCIENRLIRYLQSFLTEQNPCINKGIRVVLIHGYETVRVRFWGRHKIRHCDVCVIPESIIIKTSPSIGAILDARENERFKIFSTLLLVRTLPFEIITIKHPFLIHQPAGHLERG